MSDYLGPVGPKIVSESRIELQRDLFNFSCKKQKQNNNCITYFLSNSEENEYEQLISCICSSLGQTRKDREPKDKKMVANNVFMESIVNANKRKLDGGAVEHNWVYIYIYLCYLQSSISYYNHQYLITIIICYLQSSISYYNHHMLFTIINIILQSYN